MFRATGVIFFAYIGFDAVSVAAQEAKNPQRDIPIGILGSLVICTVLYMLMSLVHDRHRALHHAECAASRVAALSRALPATAWLAPYVNIGAMVGLASVVLVLLLGQSRIFYAMARDGMIPPLFSRHPSALPHALERHHHHRLVLRAAGRACCRSTFWASWSPSAPWWPSSSSASASWCCGCASPT